MTRFRIINWWIARKLEGFHILLAAGGSLACLTGSLQSSRLFPEAAESFCCAWRWWF